MNPINQLLERYARFVAPDNAIRKALVMSIKEVANLDVNERSIKIIHGVAYIDVDTTFKSALFLYQESILKKTEEHIGKKGLIGIR